MIHGLGHHAATDIIEFMPDPPLTLERAKRRLPMLRWWVTQSFHKSPSGSTGLYRSARALARAAALVASLAGCASVPRYTNTTPTYQALYLSDGRIIPVLPGQTVQLADGSYRVQTNTPRLFSNSPAQEERP